MDMPVLVYDPYVPAATIKAAGCEPVTDLDAALARADVVTIHCPKNPETIGMFNAARFARMKPGAFIINTARGGIIDEFALKDALASGKLAGAGIDVFDKEPPAADNPIYDLPNTIVSAHMAGVTTEFDGSHGDCDGEEHSLGARRHAEQGKCGEQGGFWLGGGARLLAVEKQRNDANFVSRFDLCDAKNAIFPFGNTAKRAVDHRLMRIGLHSVRIADCLLDPTSLDLALEKHVVGVSAKDDTRTVRHSAAVGNLAPDATCLLASSNSIATMRPSAS